MKKLFALMLALTLIVSLAACSGSGQGGENASNQTEAPTEPAVLHISDDTDVLDMSITPPEDYVSVKRTLDRHADTGAVIEKNLAYTFSDGSVLTFATSCENEENQAEYIIENIGEDKTEKREIGSKTFYVFEYGSELYAINQTDDVAYGIRYQFSEDSSDSSTESTEEKKSSEIFDKALESVSFTDNKTTEENEEGLGDIKYSLDDSLNVVSVYDELEETKDGEMVRKSYTWRIGKDKDNIDFRLLVRVIKNAKIEDELNDDYTYSEKTSYERDYTVREVDGNDCEYYYQKGDDVYIIKNLGNNTGWSVNRSEESYQALDALMQTVSFD